MNINKQKTVFVGVSGGVDSSVSAALLKDQGFNVVGVFIRTWTPDFINCTWRDERRDAMRVCSHLEIPFFECDAEEAYKKGVADYMINEYRQGKTPNPDVMCNREVKFGVFWDFAKSKGADYIATGHYCQNNYESKVNNYELKKGVDSSKDQAYFLWTLKQDDLTHILFPVGHLLKSQVRKLAIKYKLPTATKKDSQGVCFLGPLDMKDFLKHYIPTLMGNILDNTGKVIGEHDGAMFFTLGERHGFKVSNNINDNRPLYVVSKNIDNNTITVSAEPINYSFSDQHKEKINSKVALQNVNWICVPLEENIKYQAQIRYHGELLDCTVKSIDGKNAIINFFKNILVDSGQSIVIYKNNICLGGGTVK